jgi:hypothetical protein
MHITHTHGYASPCGSLVSFLSKASCFPPPVNLKSFCCTALFCIEQFDSILPHFIFTSIPWLPSRPPSSETAFQNLFFNSAVELPYDTYSPLSSFNEHACYQTDYCFPQFWLLKYTMTCLTFEPQFMDLSHFSVPTHDYTEHVINIHGTSCNDSSQTLPYQGWLLNFSTLFMRNVLFE